jgi:hypothetical protein
MRHARTSFWGLPQLTVRRMMIYVAVIAVAPQVVLEFRRLIDHWVTCKQLAAHYSKEATLFRRIAIRYPGNTVAPPVAYLTESPCTPVTGEFTARKVPYYEALANLYESAKWRPWAGMPTEPPPPLWLPES